MNMEQTVYDLYAVKYATNSRRTARDSFLAMHDIHDGPMPLDFFVWVAVCGERVILIDSGADEATCRTRGHDFLRCPSQGLRDLGLSPERVTDIIVTHMHWDHVGNFDKFPNARFHIHPTEMAHATGPCMCHSQLRRPYDVEQVCSMIKALYGGRVEFSRTDHEIAAGISVHHVGGHTPGLQVVRVRTRRGWVVLASDAIHYYANAARSNPYPVVVNVDDYLDAHRMVLELADSEDHVVAGHDPIVLEMYPPASEQTRGIAVRLDVPPLIPAPISRARS
jgi:glyoxylase-like metal-dependent hydrolase (beta-lactamase superfamily II)